MKTRIVYLEDKSRGLRGPARICRVTVSKTGKTLRYGALELQRWKGGFKWNHFDAATGAEYWVSGPRRDGADRLYGEGVPVHIDEDVRVEYWTSIRRLPRLVTRATT